MTNNKNDVDRGVALSPVDVKERLLEFIGWTGLSVRRFEIECGFPNAYVSNITRSITPQRLAALAQRFPELNLPWLTTGEGEMLRSSVAAQDEMRSETDEVAEAAQTGKQTVEAGSTDVTGSNLERAIGIIDRLAVMHERYSETVLGQTRAAERQGEIIFHLNRTIDNIATASREHEKTMSTHLEHMSVTVERCSRLVQAMMTELIYTWSQLAERGADITEMQREIGSVCLLSQNQIDDCIK